MGVAGRAGRIEPGLQHEDQLFAGRDVRFLESDLLLSADGHLGGCQQVLAADHGGGHSVGRGEHGGFVGDCGGCREDQYYQCDAGDVFHGTFVVATVSCCQDVRQLDQGTRPAGRIKARPSWGRGTAEYRTRSICGLKFGGFEHRVAGVTGCQKLLRNGCGRCCRLMHLSIDCSIEQRWVSCCWTMVYGVVGRAESF